MAFVLRLVFLFTIIFRLSSTKAQQQQQIFTFLSSFWLTDVASTSIKRISANKYIYVHICMKRCAIVFVIINVAIPMQPQPHMQRAMWCRFITNLCLRFFFISLFLVSSLVFYFAVSFLSFFAFGFSLFPLRFHFFAQCICINAHSNICHKCDGVPHKFGRLTEKDKSQEQFFSLFWFVISKSEIAFVP